MNTVMLNNAFLDGNVVVKKGGGSSGGVPIKNQEKSVDIVANGTTDVTPDAGFTGLSKVLVNVNVPSSGGGAVVSKGAVTFYDYDGVVLHSYTKDEFLALSAMPELPEREGLICQEWNWSFEDAVAYVQDYGILDVGATYITDDGKTRLYIRIAAEGRMDVPLYFSQTVANGVVIDWGDGSETETLGGMWNVNTTHKYAEIGDYVITLDPVDGCTLVLGYGSSYSIMGFISRAGQAYCNMLQKVEAGRGVTSIGGSAFSTCYSLSSVVIPNSITNIESSAFYNCYSLSSVVIPNSITNIGNSAFYNCYSLSSVVIPNSITNIGNSAFNACYSLSSVVIPNSITNIESSAFSTCYSLSSVVIPNSITNIGSSAFNACQSLSSVVIPNSITNIESSAFRYCSSLSSIVIPDGVTSIANQTFEFCSSLSSIVIPDGVTSIGNATFRSCHSMPLYDFSTCAAVPTLSSTGAFQDIASDCKIIVPDALYDEWIAATNWSSFASQIVKASEFNA